MKDTKNYYCYFHKETDGVLNKGIYGSSQTPIWGSQYSQQACQAQQIALKNVNKSVPSSCWVIIVHQISSCLVLY